LRKYIVPMSVDTTCDRLIKIYEELLSRRRRADSLVDHRGQA